MQIISPWEIAWLFKKSTVWLCCSVEQEEGDADAPVQPIRQRCPCSRDVLLSLSPRLTPSRVSRKPRASEPCAGPACVHPNASSTSQHPRGSAQQLRAPSLPAAVARRLPGSALLGRGSFLPSLRPAHRPPSSAPRAGAPRRAELRVPAGTHHPACPVPLQKGTAGKESRGSCLRYCIHPFPPSWGSVLPVPLVGCPHHFGPFYRSPSCGSGCHHRHAFMRVGLCKACIKCSQKYEVLSFVKLIKMSNNFYKGKMSHWMAHFSLLAFYN